MCFYLNNIQIILIITKTVIAFLSTFTNFGFAVSNIKNN